MARPYPVPTVVNPEVGYGGAVEVSVVVITRDRCDELMATLSRLVGLTSSGEVAEVVLVDNGSTDQTVPEVRRRYPSVELLALPYNAGAAARNAGARHARTPLVAFSDDDSWWDPGSLARATGLFDRHPRLGLVAACVVVEPAGTVDPTCELMARSALPSGLPGLGDRYRQVLGFLACGSVARRDAFLPVGGFRSALGIGGEEALVAIDLAAGGWCRLYAPDVVARHRPSVSREPLRRRKREVRNALWTAWSRRAAVPGLRQTIALVREAAATPAGRAGVMEALAGVAWPLRHRSVVPGAVEAELTAVGARRYEP